MAPIMTKTLISSVLLITMLPMAGSARSQQTSVNASAAVLAGFTGRVTAYADLRKSLEKGDAKLKSTTEPGELDAARKSLAARLQAARPAAKLGDIFTVDSRPVFRRLLSPQLKGTDGAENKGAIKDDNPGAVAIKVNAPYPSKAPLSTVPPDILKALPVLPDDLDYRFVGKHLILYDTKAGLVIDYIPNAIP